MFKISSLCQVEFKICRVFKSRVSDIFEFVFVKLEIATQICQSGITK